jgi:arylsulfatase
MTLGMVSLAEAVPRQSRPNIVLFIADDVSFDDFGCYGHPVIRTPHIDRLAARGVRFENAYLTISSCSPTRTSLITGRYPHNTGAPELHMGDSPILEKLPQFPHLLREAGYHSVQAGKTHFNGNVDKSFDLLHGLDESGPSGSDRWVKCLRERPKDRPFFMWFSSLDAHRPWDMSPREGRYETEEVVVAPYHFDGPRTRYDLARYYEEVSRFDDNVGRVVAELRRQNVLEDTLIIVMADNGRPFPRDKTWLYDSGIKTPLIVHWPAGVRTPAVTASLVSIIDLAPTVLEIANVRVPDTMQGVSLVSLLGQPSSSVRDFVFAERNWHTLRYHERLVRHENWVYIRNSLPEFYGFDITTASREESLAYIELAHAWHAGRLSEPEVRAFSLRHHPAQWEVFRRPRPVEQLFDVAADPLQLDDRAGDPAYAERLAYLRRVLDVWIAETGDTLPAVEKMTADRVNRETWEVISREAGRPNPGEVPGLSTDAHEINARGPVFRSDLP